MTTTGPNDNCSHCGGSGWKGDDPDNPDPCHCTTAPDSSGMWTCPDCAFSFDAEHTDVGGGYSCPVCAETRLAAEVAALRTAVRSLDSFVASTLGSVASMTEWDDDDWGISGFDSGTRAAIRRALTEDTGTDRELIAAHATPPVCTTCNGTRLKPWQLLTDSELAPALRTICDRTGTSIPCPDCTEDTTDTPTDRSIP